MLQRTPSHGAVTVYQIDCWCFDTASRDLSDGTRSRRLRPKAAAVLTALAEAEGQVLSRSALLDRVWPGIHVGEEVLTQAIAEIRRAVGDKSARQVVETVHGTGYRVGRPVRTLAEEEPPSPPGREGAFDLEAFLDCCEARRLCEQNGERALAQAVALCGTAAARAPRSAPILAEFAALSAMQRLYSDAGGRDDGSRGLANALEPADRAAGLRPDLACGHMARGVVLAALGRRDAACAAFNQAIMSDPQDFAAHYHYARALFAFRAYSQAARVAECAAAFRPDDFRPLFVIAASRSALGDRERAAAAAETGLNRLRLRLAPGDRGRRAEHAESLFLALGGHHEAAHRSLAERPGNPPATLYYDVATYAALHEVDQALDRLEQIADHGFRHIDWLRADPTLAPLRAAPRYQRLMTTLGSA